MPLAAEDEERYDRQIRLWGAEAQQNLRNADILMVGVSGAGSEIVKNVVLSGINSMTLYDSTKLSSKNQQHLDHLAAQMLIPHETKISNSETTYAEASLPRCTELNPNVTSTSISAIPYEEISNGKYTVVCACDQPREIERKLSAACRSSKSINVPFLTCKTNGWFGMSVLDAGENYSCQVKQLGEEKGGEKRGEDADEECFVEQSFCYKDFGEVCELIEQKAFKKLKKRELKNLNQALIACTLSYKNQKITKENCENIAAQITDSTEFYTGKNAEFHDLDEVEVLANGQFSPVCAIVGGFCAQEVIRLASKKEKPLDNLFLFDGKHYKGDIMKV